MNQNKYLYITIYLIIGCSSFSSCTKNEEQDSYYDEIDAQISRSIQDTLVENAKERYLSGSEEVADEEMYDPRSNRERKIAVIPMDDERGVSYVWVTINGIRLRAIFDTGASDVSLSLTEAMLLYKQGSLSIEDYVGEANYKIANGDLVPGKVVLLKNVNIGGVDLYDVRASIMQELDAPILLGQSVFKRFSSIAIDNIKKEIVLEY
ncbi:MAG: retropepsin-like aspartic protease family protein [Chitinophagaceae bacterium]